MDEPRTDEKMIQGALNALSVVLVLQKSERMLVVTDKEKQEIGAAFVQAGERIGAIISIHTLQETERLLLEISG